MYKICKCNEITSYVYAACCSTRSKSRSRIVGAAAAAATYKRIMQNYAKMVEGEIQAH